MKKADLKIISTRAQIRGQLMVHERCKLTPQGTLAVEIVRSLSLAAIPDGETSTGEQKYRPLTPAEIVEKAVAVSGLIYDKVESKGWVLDVPSFEEIEKFDGDASAPGFLPASGGLTKGKETV